MLLLSNNLRGKVPFPDGSVVRVNAAWVKSERKLRRILEENDENDVFLDFPNGRTKPPKPVLTLSQLLKFTKNYKNIRYFAVSNAEDEEYMRYILNLLPEYTELVPKIETISGVKNIEKIVEASKCSMVMLDKEDLYLGCGTDTKLYEHFMSLLDAKCLELGVKIIKLCGVAFE